MEFLVEIEILLPPGMAADQASELVEKERERGKELLIQGIISRIWRVPGRRANVGVWVAPDADVLHREIASLPMFPWLEVHVRPLSTHPLEAPIEE